MCVIILKPRGRNLPTRSELKAAYRRNPDGCGFVSEHEFFKSMSFDEFYDKLRTVKKDENCIIHFRWATQGSVCERNCHPFYDESTNTYFAHNGVFNAKPKTDITDSEYVFKTKITGLIKKDGLGTPQFRADIAPIIGGSRIAFMDSGHIVAYGDFIPHGGCYYSNLHHVNVPFRYAV